MILHDNMDLAEEFVKYLIKYALDNCSEDLEFLNNMIDKGLLERLKFVLDNQFVRITYTEAVEFSLHRKENGSIRLAGDATCRLNMKDILLRNILKDR